MLIEELSSPHQGQEGKQAKQMFSDRDAYCELFVMFLPCPVRALGYHYAMILTGKKSGFGQHGERLGE